MIDKYLGHRQTKPHRDRQDQQERENIAVVFANVVQQNDITDRRSNTSEYTHYNAHDEAECAKPANGVSRRAFYEPGFSSALMQNSAASPCSVSLCGLARLQRRTALGTPGRAFRNILATYWACIHFLGPFRFGHGVFGRAEPVPSMTRTTTTGTTKTTAHGQDAHATHGRDARATHGQDVRATLKQLCYRLYQCLVLFIGADGDAQLVVQARLIEVSD